MPRRSREDAPGAWHHVMNRGQAKRPVFLTKTEIRYFLSRLAREVHRQEIEVHGYSILTTHFHLLLRSTNGSLSDAMRRIENSFVRWFNRRHCRDGALFRGRFTSLRIRSERYWNNVRDYIDQNPVSAGLVQHPSRYPYGSARYRSRSGAPAWLHIDPELDTNSEPIHTSHASWVIERRMENYTQDADLDDLVGAAPQRVRSWMEHKTRVADGKHVPHCLISPQALRLAICLVKADSVPWWVAPRTRRKEGWRVLELGLAREFVGLSTLEAALRLDVPRSTAGHSLLEHRRLMLADSTYASRAAEVLARGLAITFPAG